MGVDGGHKLTFRLLNLNFEHLLTIARSPETSCRLRRRWNTSTYSSIYLDASWISQKFKARKGGPINAILDIVTGFAKEGFCATIVCDGARRHDSKRASVDRQSQREKTRIMAHVKRADIICKKAALIAAAGTTSEMQLRQEINKPSTELNKTTTAQEIFW